MSDLYATGDLRPPHDDARLDVTEVYAFQSPQNHDASIFVMCVNPLAPTMADGFHPGASYNMHLDVNDDGAPDLMFQITFSPKRDAQQQADVVLLATAGAEIAVADREGVLDEFDAYEEMLFEQVPVSPGERAEIAESGPYRFFCGMRSDPTFFDLEGYREGMRFTGTDFYADKNVYAIVLQVPNFAFERQPVEFWCQVMIGGEQVDRMGRPLTNMLFVPDEVKNAFVSGDPLEDVQEFTGPVTERLLTSGSGYTEHEASQLSQQLLPDTLTYDCTNRFGFPNGRRLTDNVVDEQLAILAKNTAPEHGLPPHQDLLDDFPYLGAPHRVELPEQRTGEQAADRAQG